MNKADMCMYRDIKNILKNGYKDINPRPKYSDGTPAHTISVNQVIRRYDLSNDEFPICTLRPIAWKSAIKEILWIYQDQTSNLNVLRNKYNVHYWNDWESKNVPNTIGQRYGATVKRYDLINNLIKDIQNDPYGRRKVVSLWQESDLRETDGLAPCAFLTMWNVRNDCKGNEYLDMTLIQRSGDMLTASGAGGVNEVQYAALLMMIARHTGYKVGVFCHFVENEQIYDRHIDTAKEIQKRFNSLKYEEDRYLEDIPKYPKLILNQNKTNFYDFTIDDFTMENYYPVKPNLKLDLGI